MELVVFFLLPAAFWLLLIRPQQQRLRAQRDLIASLEVGDRIVTAGGLIGTIVHLDDRDADVEVADGVVLKFLRPAISRRLEADEDAGAGAGLDAHAHEDAHADDDEDEGPALESGTQHAPSGSDDEFEEGAQ